MDKREAIKRAGTASKLAKILGISNSAVSQWKAIPEARLWQLKAMRPEWFL
jgi:DNA-binding transcriptional regulator YdaS (Cro superfamily)